MRMDKILPMPNARVVKRILLLAISLMTGLFVEPTQAATITWTNAAGGNWNDPANWDPNQVPGIVDHVIIYSGSVTIPADGVFAVLDLTGGNISGSLMIASNGIVNWMGGYIGYPNGSLTVASNAVLNVSGSDYKYLYAPLTNSGTINWTGTGQWWLLGQYGATINNTPGGLFDIQSDSTLFPAYVPAVFNNAGTVRKSAGTGTSTIGLNFNNTGMVAVLQGTLNFQGQYSENPSANLAISLSGTTPSSGYGNISFSISPTFYGTFTVNAGNGYLPSPGTVFQVLNYPSFTNSFTCLGGLDLGGGILLQPQFSATGLTLLATSYTMNASQPKLFISPTLGGVAITWPDGFPDWTLQSTTNLSSPAWTAVPDACGNQAVLPVSSPRQYFRLMINPLATMTTVPAGSFTMGDALDGEVDAVPVSVTVSAFYLDTNLVSYSLWQSVYNYATNHGYGFVHAGAGKAANHPVQTVDWYDCVKWCNARSQQAGLTPVYYMDAGLTQVYTNGEINITNVYWAANGYRLPTEAEWEKAARGGLSGQRFPWGNTISESQANYQGNTATNYDLGPNGFNAIGSIGGTSPATSTVGSFSPNGYGLYDMAGNLNEWCWDWNKTPYAGGTDPRGPASGTARILRGGVWDFNAYGCRCANRVSNLPSVAFATVTGFRCARGH
jgi:formylglycine-generating enzyme